MKHKRPTCEEIAARAYQIHAESGRRHGHDLDDWLQAEYELMHMTVGELAKLTLPKTPESRKFREARTRHEAVTDWLTYQLKRETMDAATFKQLLQQVVHARTTKPAD